MQGVDKAFGSTKAVQHVDIEVSGAEVVALMGGNGAGKSTLMNILGGLMSADAGLIELLGKQLDETHSPQAAMKLGLRFVHQELSLCANLRVFENFAIEQPDMITGLRWKKHAIRIANDALNDVFPGCRIDPRWKVDALSLSQQQVVEIARAVTHPAVRLVILDEPTSSLGSREAAQLRDYIKRRRSDGVSFIFISHRLNEFLDLADRIVVMRNGSVAWSGQSDGISQAGLIELLGGRLLERAGSSPPKIVRSAPIVEVHGLRQGPLRDVDLVADRGEIVGLAGLEGSGQREVLRAIFHAADRPGGSLTVQGRTAFVSGDRAREGVFPLWSIDENIAISTLGRFSRWGFIARSKVAEITRAWFSSLKIRAASGAAPVVSLSGGNQQKAVIARALATEADLILLDDPTRGVDLGTKADLYQLFRSLASQGRTLLWYSSDDTEFAQCDRTLVMSDGAIVAEFSREELTEERLIEASFRSALDVSETGFAQHKAERAQRREAIVSTLIPLITFALVLTICVTLNPLILSPFGLSLVFSAAFALTFAAMSQLFIIAAGDIDLGLGAFIGMVNAVAATWLVSDPWLAALCFVGMLLAYPLMGLFIDMRRVPAIIVTLGLSFVWVGLAALRLPRAGGSAPDWLVDILRVKTPLVPLPVLLCILPAAVAYVVLMVSRYGVVLRGYGASPKAIEAAGWSTRTAKASLYGFAGLFAFLTGILVTASTRGGDPTGSASMTLLSVAAVILGGAAFSGGIVAPIGALFGTLTLVLVGTLLSLVGADAVFLPMVQGMLLLAVIGLRVLLIRSSWRPL